MSSNQAKLKKEESQRASWLSTTLPDEGARMLRAAALSRDMMLLDHTLRTVRRKYPKFFQPQEEMQQNG